MKRKRRMGKVVFAIGFIVLLFDGAAAIWLGQLRGFPALIVVGLLLMAAAAGLVFAYRQWMVALEAVEEARRDLKNAIGDLRSAARLSGDEWKGREP